MTQRIYGLIGRVTLLLFVLSGCGKQNIRQEIPLPQVEQPFSGTYKPIISRPVLITNATLLTGTGERLDNSDILPVTGKIQAIGKHLNPPADTIVIDGTGKWLTPGLIDVHSHLGVYPSPSHEANMDGNEVTNPNTVEVWAEHNVWTQDPQFTLALAGGVTSLKILPGSANLLNLKTTS